MKTRYFRYLLLLPFISIYHYHINHDFERGIGLGLVSLMVLTLIAAWNHDSYTKDNTRHDWTENIF